MNLEKLLDDDFSDMVPPHLKNKGVDARVINALIDYCDNPEIVRRLYLRMDPATEEAFHKTLDWYVTQERNERYAALRLGILKQRQEIEEAKRRIFPRGIGDAINEVYVTYLIKHGLSVEKANSKWRKFLLFTDRNLAAVSGRTIHEIEPKGFGPYSVIGHPIRTAVRHFMLAGAQHQQYT